MRAEPGQDVRRHRSLVADVAAQDQVPAAIGTDEVGVGQDDRDAVRGGVQRDRGSRQPVDLGRLDRCRARQRTGDRGDAAAGGEIEHAAADDACRVIQHVACERLPARPGERPKRLLHVVLGEPSLAGLPDRRYLIRQVQGDLGDERSAIQSSVGRHE
jgi:hypothetical protein